MRRRLGFEAVFCAWGMKGDNVTTNALQIRRRLRPCLRFDCSPVFRSMGFAAQAAPTMATGRRPALAGVASYLFYYKAISKIGAARGMALNIPTLPGSYSRIALGNVPDLSRSAAAFSSSRAPFCGLRLE
ncbi:MAG: hypothetical protein ACLTYW_08250 [Collinsella sp.]